VLYYHNTTSVKAKQIFGLNPNVFFLGLVSFLTDVSSEMIFTLLPLFLLNVLGVATTVIGLIEGVADATASLFRILSGWLSDRLGKRKGLTILGYGLSTAVKPLMYIASTWGMVLGVRFCDRMGKGVRTAPRDALVADSVTSGQRGKAFGLHSAMDTFGAMVGIISAAVVVFLWQGGRSLELSRAIYQQLVLIGIIPAVIALFIFFFIKEPERSPAPQSSIPIGRMRKLTFGLDKRFWIFLGIIFLFTLGNSSDAFLILRAQNLGNPVLTILLMLVLFNFVYASLSTPAGILSDKLGRRRIILLGWLIYTLVYLGFAMASVSWQVWLLFGFYGVYYGLAEGVARAFVADLVPEEKRGTAYGLFHGIVGVTLLPASLIAGYLWQVVNPAAPFFFGAIMAFLAMIGFLVLVKE